LGQRVREVAGDVAHLIWRSSRRGSHRSGASVVTKAGRRQLDASKPEEMGGVGGWVEEHPRVGAEVMDVEVAPDGGRRGLSAWRASAAVVQRRASLGGAAR
jgi:hypothetical protein